MPDMNYVVVTAAECPVEKRAMAVEKTVSYTHLTLPTIAGV